jgi:hypothetical protein
LVDWEGKISPIKGIQTDGDGNQTSFTVTHPESGLDQDIKTNATSYRLGVSLGQGLRPWVDETGGEIGYTRAGQLIQDEHEHHAFLMNAAATGQAIATQLAELRNEEPSLAQCIRHKDELKLLVSRYDGLVGQPVPAAAVAGTAPTAPPPPETAPQPAAPTSKKKKKDKNN